MSSERINANNAPSAQVMRLRKYAADRRIRACVAQFCERRLWLLMERLDPRDCDAETGDKALAWLCLDVRRGASLHFLTAETAPEEEVPRWPAPDNLAEACAAWRQWPVLTPALRRTLACLDEKERAALLVDLREGDGNIFVYREPGRLNICLACAWPLPPALRGDLVEEEGEHIPTLLEKAGRSLVLSRFAEEGARAESRFFDRQARKLERLQQRLLEEEIRLTAMLGAQTEALALQDNLWRFPREIRGGKVAVPAGAHGPDREIHLAAGRTARQEMEALFHTAKRGRRGLKHLARRRAELEEEAAALAGARPLLPRNPRREAGDEASGAASVAARKSLPKKIRAFVSDDGFVLLRGRDSEGNLAALKLAAPHDIWLHTENGPGAHVIIRRAYAGQEVPELTLVQAGILAACKSRAAGAGKARIIYAEARHVKALRKAPAGAVRIDKIRCSRHVDIDAALEERLAL